MPEMVKADQSCKMLRLCGTLNAMSLAANFATKDADAKTKKKMDFVNAATYAGLAAGISQFDAEKDFGGPAGAVMKYGNMACQLAMAGAYMKRAMDAK